MTTAVGAVSLLLAVLQLVFVFSQGLLTLRISTFSSSSKSCSSINTLPVTMSDDFMAMSGVSNVSVNQIERITFVSSNEYKVQEVKLILGEDFPFELQTKSVDLFEPQAPPVEVSRWKCFQAAKLCNGPVIVEDTSLCFNALNGLPGPYIKWFYEAIGNEGLVKLLDGHEDKTGLEK